MASRTSNFCIDGHDPATQARWWAQALDDFVLPSEQDQQEWDDECCWWARTAGRCSF